MYLKQHEELTLVYRMRSENLIFYHPRLNGLEKNAGEASPAAIQDFNKAHSKVPPPGYHCPGL